MLRAIVSDIYAALLGAPGYRRKIIITRDNETFEKYRIQIVERAIQTLLSFAAPASSQTLEELAKRTGTNKTTMLRIIRTLENAGFLVRDDDRYRLGARVLDISNAYLSTLTINKVAQKPMESLANEFGQTVSVAILDEADVVYVAIEQAQRELGIQGEVGGRHPAHATALGKVLLSGLNPEDARARLKSRELVRLTHRTLVDVDDVMASVERVKRDGYALDDEERGIGIRCVAAPIHDRKGLIVAAMSIAGPIFYMQDDQVEKILGRLLESTHEIDAEMGWTGG